MKFKNTTKHRVLTPGTNVLVVSEAVIEQDGTLYMPATINTVTKCGDIVCISVDYDETEDMSWSADCVFVSEAEARAAGNKLLAAMIKGEHERHAYRMEQLQRAAR